MKKVLAALAALFMVTSSAHAIAGLVDIEIGTGVWNAEPSGNVMYGATGTDVDIADDLKLDASSNSYIYAKFDHFIPIVPNLRVEMQNYTTSGDGTLGTVTFGDKTFTSATTTDLTLNQQDYTFYWGIPGLGLLTAGILDVEFGINVKQIDGEITLTSGTTTETASFNVPVPMLYGAIVIDIPVIPVGLEVSSKWISVGDSKIQDNKAKVDVSLPLPIPLVTLAVEAGIKQQTIQIADDLVKDLDVTIDNSGVFFGANLKF